jgi:hypothetical protein
VVPPARSLSVSDTAARPPASGDTRVKHEWGCRPGLHQRRARRQAGVRPSGRSGGHGPTRSHSFYRLSWSPAVAEIVGDGRPWTVLMISLLSMPCR